MVAATTKLFAPRHCSRRPARSICRSGHLAMGSVRFDLLANLLVGSIPAAIAGAMLSARLPHLFLRVTLSVVLLLIGIKLAVCARSIKNEFLCR